MNMKNRIHFIDNFCFQNDTGIYRYSSLDYVEKGFVGFSSPEHWKDLHEHLFLHAKYRYNRSLIPFKFVNRIFCLCLTKTEQCEAAWKAYGNNIVKFEVCCDSLMNMLEDNVDKYDIYVGKVNYVLKSDLERKSPLKLLNVKKDDFEKDETWVKLLFYKTKAFEYENEIRIVLVSDGKENCDRIKLRYNMTISDLFPKVFLSPDLGECDSYVNVNKLVNLGYSPEAIQKDDLYKCGKYRETINLDYGSNL